MIEKWRVEYNTERPHSALGYRPPAPQAILPKQRGMEIWKTLRVSHIPTPPAATTDKCLTRRYTNTPLGTKDRSGQSTTNGYSIILYTQEHFDNVRIELTP